MDTLLERETVLSQLAGLRRRAARGAGRVVFLRGEAGVGKTAVVTGFLGERRDQMRVLRGWCDPLSAPRPLGPLVDMLAQLRSAEAAQLAAVLDRGEPKAIYSRLLGLFGDGNRWVCVIEDVHWADGATLDLLRFLARRVASLPVLLVVSYRDDEVGPQHPLAVALGDVTTHSTVIRIGLDPLSRDAVAVLAAGSGVNADGLHRLTGGNPFFVTEVLAAAQDAPREGGLPRSVSEAVCGRLGRLSTGARETAYAAAVCGPRAEAGLLETVYPGAGAALAECLHTGVLVADGPLVGFRHELARRAAIDQIPDCRRREMHSRALAALAEPPPAPDRLGALAFHADQAGDHSAVIRYAPPAAERAAALGAHGAAADLYALVLRHSDAIPAEQKVVWLERHGLTSYLSGLSEAPTRSWREAIALRHRLGDRLQEGDNLRWLSHMQWRLGHTSAATEAGLASLRVLQDLGPSAQLAWSLVNMAHAVVFSDPSACADYATRAIALGSQLGERAVVLRARGYGAMATVLCSDAGWDEFEAVWREAMAIEELAEHAALIGANIGWTAALHRQLDRAERYIADTITFCADREQGGFQPLAISVGALVGLDRGDWERAAAFAEDVLTRPGHPPVHRIWPLITQGLIRARRGQQHATALLDEALGCSEVGYFRRAVWAARAEAAWLAGDDDTARAEARKGLSVTVGSVADPWLAGPLQRWAYMLDGRSDIAAVKDTVTPYRLEIRGDWKGAADEWTRRGCPYDAALAQLGGDLPAVQSALTTFRRLGARAAARRAQQRLATLRGRTHYGRRADTHTRADPHGLTRRQRDVLELLAAGHSDTDIATKLCISPKTVGHHVEAILTKLGVENRIQAATAFSSHRQPPE